MMRHPKPIKKIAPPMISVSDILTREEMDSFIHTLLDRAILSMNYNYQMNYKTNPITNKTMFYLTGVFPSMEKDIRELIDHYRNEFSGYIIRLTKRAYLDAMLTVTITRRIDSSPRYLTIAG